MASISVCTICLNESEYIEYALHNPIRCSAVSEIIIVEGAVKNASHMANAGGHSIDNTVSIIKKLEKKHEKVKVFMKDSLWNSKIEMRNKCIDLMTGEILFFIDADEIYHLEDLYKLSEIADNEPEIILFLIKHLHFWKNFRQITVGSMWDSFLFRCCRIDKSLGFRHRHHHATLMDKNKRKVWVLDPFYKTHTIDTKINCYHFGPVKKPSNVLGKLEYYRRRGQKVKDTYSNWKPGQETQWTNSGGTVKPFKGRLPEIMKKHPYYNLAEVK